MSKRSLRQAKSGSSRYRGIKARTKVTVSPRPADVAEWSKTLRNGSDAWPVKLGDILNRQSK